MHRGEEVDVVFLDFAKAFDTVFHQMLLQKNNSFGVSTQVHTWILLFSQVMRQ